MRHVRVNGTELRCNSTLRNCDCLGNLISDGKYIQTSKAINANFGIREGKFIIGYVSENEVLHNKNDKKFDQLVSGVIWPYATEPTLFESPRVLKRLDAADE